MVCHELKNGNAYLVVLFASTVMLEETHSGWNWVSLLQITRVDSNKKRKKKKRIAAMPYSVNSLFRFFSVFPKHITLAFICVFLFFLWIDKPQTSAKTTSKLKCFIFPGCGANSIKKYH